MGKRNGAGDNSSDDTEHDEEGFEDETNDDDDGDDARFTQSDFDKAVTKARKNARSANTKKILDELGADSIEDAKVLLQTAKAKPKSKAKEDEDDSSSTELAAAKAEIAQMKADSLKRETTGRIKEALVEAGLSPQAAKRAANLVELEANPSDEEIGDEISDLREAMPQLFANAENEDDDDDGDADDDGNKSRGSSQPPRPKKKKKASSSSSQVDDMFAQRHPQLSNQ